MGTPLYPEAYEELVNGDIAWLKKNTEPCLEQNHIIAVLKHSVKEYEARGYMESMCHEGPVYGGKTGATK